MSKCISQLFVGWLGLGPVKSVWAAMCRDPARNPAGSFRQMATGCASVPLCLPLCVCVWKSAVPISPFCHHHKLTFSDFKSLLKVKLICAWLLMVPFRSGLKSCCLHFTAITYQKIFYFFLRNGNVHILFFAWLTTWIAKNSNNNITVNSYPDRIETLFLKYVYLLYWISKDLKILLSNIFIFILYFWSSLR